MALFSKKNNAPKLGEKLPKKIPTRFIVASALYTKNDEGNYPQTTFINYRYVNSPSKLISCVSRLEQLIWEIELLIDEHDAWEMYQKKRDKWTSEKETKKEFYENPQFEDFEYKNTEIESHLEKKDLQ